MLLRCAAKASGWPASYRLRRRSRRHGADEFKVRSFALLAGPVFLHITSKAWAVSLGYAATFPGIRIVINKNQAEQE